MIGSSLSLKSLRKRNSKIKSKATRRHSTLSIILFVTFVTTKGPLKSVLLKNFWHYGAMPEIKFIQNYV
jgi:hypothetical protein